MSVSPQTMGIVGGGLVPAIAYSAFATGTKFATQAGLGTGPLLVMLGASCAAVGAVFWWLLPSSIGMASAGWGIASGLAWAFGTGLVSLALFRWGTPISKLNPLTPNLTHLLHVIHIIRNHLSNCFSHWPFIRALSPHFRSYEFHIAHI